MKTPLQGVCLKLHNIIINNGNYYYYYFIEVRLNVPLWTSWNIYFLGFQQLKKYDNEYFHFMSTTLIITLHKIRGTKLCPGLQEK